MPGNPYPSSPNCRKNLSASWRILSLISALILLIFLPLATASAAPAESQPAPSPLANLAWEKLGGPPGGSGSSLAFDPDDPAVLYLSDLAGGVFISRDGGENWKASNQGITIRTGQSGDLIPVSCLAVDPHHEKTIWAGTSNPAYVYRSEDGGVTWQLRARGIAGYVGLTLRSITFSPQEPDVIYAAAEINSTGWNLAPKPGKIFDQAKGILFKSTDGGSWWLPIWRGDSLANKVVIDPLNPARVYLATGAYDREAANESPEGDALAQMGGLGVLVSLDGGITWSDTSAGLGNLHVQSLSIHEEEEGLLLAATGNLAFPDGAGIYRSEDAGATWERAGGEEGEVITGVLFSPADSDTAYATGQEHIYISQDRGVNWEIAAPEKGTSWGPDGIKAGTPLSISTDPHHPGTLYTLTDLGGVYRSEDGGKGWVETGNGYSAASIRSLSVDPANPAVVYALSGAGPFKSDNGGLSWQGITPPDYPVSKGGSLLETDPYHSGRLYLADGESGIFLVSSDAGQTWQKTLDLGADLAQYGTPGLGVMGLGFAPDEKRVYAGIGILNCKLFEQSCRTPVFLSLMGSDNSGDTWKAINAWRLNGLTVLDVVVNPESPEQLWAATGAGWALSSQDGGSKWTPLTEHLYARHITALALHPESDNIIFAATWNYGVFMSSDQGDNWDWSRLGMDPYEPLSSLVIDPARPNVMYAGSFQRGVYLSEDSGRTWRLLNNSLSVHSVRSLAIAADGNTLYAGTEGGGVYRLSTLSDAEWQALEPTATALPTATASATPTVLPTATVQPTVTVSPMPIIATSTLPPPEQPARTSCPSSFIPLGAALIWTTFRSHRIRTKR